MPRAMTRMEFDDRLGAGTLDLSFVGMSNVGKSTISDRLAKESSFVHVCCDDLIEERLGDELKAQGYGGGIQDMARWLGQPSEPQYPTNAQTYLELEVMFTRRILDGLQNGFPPGNTVVDTTGSVVHLDAAIHSRLRALTTVVYLEATPELRARLFESYIQVPKPVIWGNFYQPQAGESPEQTLERCYPHLLAGRDQGYEGMAHVIIPYEQALGAASIHGLLGNIRDGLPA